ncbi:MAG: DUF1365 domain-containing protein [Gammaproteobacteria bacterium]|nr:DUF1365 domain-containing protein [Gammaproteobacteria bacterium]
MKSCELERSGFCFGDVFHKRFLPKAHAFKYKAMTPLLNLDDLSEIASLSPLLSRNRFNLYSFYDDDYLKSFRLDGEGLKARCLRVCLAHLAEPEPEDIEKLSSEHSSVEVLMLSQWRFMGVVFNPISVFYIMEQGQLRYLMAEVSNTPWNERHVYAYNIARIGANYWSDAKRFHVSPFNPLAQTYHWRNHIDEQHLRLNLAVSEDSNLRFTASFNYHREPMTRASFYQALKQQPLFSFKTVCGIYWQALKLFINRIPFYSHPNSSMEKSSD